MFRDITKQPIYLTSLFSPTPRQSIFLFSSLLSLTVIVTATTFQIFYVYTYISLELTMFQAISPRAFGRTHRSAIVFYHEL